MGTENRFKADTILTLSKRAANRCSNPDCGAITSGPAADPTSSINVGEAAHIFGAQAGAARFDPSMSPDERRSITNAIWLCSTCHKIVDDDELRYPAGLLFEWQEQHEREMAARVGKAGADARKRYDSRHLETFGKLSYRAERIINEKERLWEYHLTAETLRFEVTPVLRRWRALKNGLYIKPYSLIDVAQFPSWLSSKLNEASAMARAFSAIVNSEFARAWGEPGVPGNDLEIVEICRLFRETCESALDWEESVRFVSVDSIFKELQDLFVGVIGNIIDEAARLPEFLANTLATSPIEGEFQLSLKLDLPDGWGESVEAAFARAARAYGVSR